MTVACATISGCPSEYKDTSPTASRLPNLINRVFAITSAAAGFLRKLMFKLVVTAIATGPIIARRAAYIAVSASVIRAAPEIVPPGRKCFEL